MNKLLIYWRTLPLLLLSILSLGCAAGNRSATTSPTTATAPTTTSGRGTATLIVSLKWPTDGVPTSSRVIPPGTFHFVVDVGTTAGGQEIASNDAYAPTTEIKLDRLPAGKMYLSATAESTQLADLAKGIEEITIAPGDVVHKTITLVPIVDSIQISPSPASVAVGKTVTLTAIPLYADKKTIVDPKTTFHFTWESKDLSIATIAPSGATCVVTGKKGVTFPILITVTETTSGKSGSVPLSVTGTEPFDPINLTDIVTVGATGTGSYVGGNDWHTADLPSQAASLWLIDGPNIDGPFLNGPSRAQSAINIPLKAGDYTFTLYGNTNLPDSEYYGINLAFNNIHRPLISAYCPTYTGQTTSFFVTNSSNTTRFDDSVVSAAGTLSYTSGNVKVTLINFWYAGKNIFNRNRVDWNATSPGGDLDNVGQFTIRVEQVSR